MKRFKLIICLFLLLTTIGANISLYAQGKKYEYWFVVPDASRIHDDNPIFFMITAGGLDAEVEISMPKNSQFVTQKKSLKAYESWRQEYTQTSDVDILENSINNSGTATNKGVLITSTAPISAYYELNGSKSGQKEIFTFKGDKALGTLFYTPFQTYYSVYTHSDAYRQIQIVAADDNTIVTFKAPIKVAKGTSGYFNANTEYSVTLQRGQTLLLREHTRNETFTGGMGLMGTYIRTNGGRIAVTTYEDSVNSQGQDPIGDQIVPVDQVGTNYIVVKGYTKLNNTTNGIKNTVDNVYILATKDNTVVKMGGVVQGTITKAGGFMRFDIEDRDTGSQFRYFETDKPVYCLHQSAVGGELGGALVPSMYSIASDRISFYNQNLSLENSIFLIYREKAKNSFQIQYANQQTPSALAVQNNATGVDGWLFSKQKLTGEAGTVTISNKDGAFALGYFASPGGTALYGYLSNFGKFSFKEPTIYACGDSYTFDGGYAKSYLWTDPKGNTATTPTFTATRSGVYKLTVNQDPDVITDETHLKLQSFEGDYKFPTAAFVNQPVDFSIKIQTIDPQGIYENDYKVEYEWTFSDEASGYSVTQTKNKNGDPLTTNDMVEVKGVTWTTAGRKKITVKINNKSAGCSTTITRNITVQDYLDNMDPDVDCWVDPPVTNWMPKLRAKSDTKVHILAQPFVGDIDGDSKLEVVTTNMDNTSGYRYSKSILIFDNNLKLKKEIPTPFIYSQTVTPLVLLRLVGESQALIVVACDDNSNMLNQKLKAYRPDGTLVWTSNAIIFNDATPAKYRLVSPSLVVGDIDNDGIPEILAGDRIFCAKTGTLLASLPGYMADPQHGRGSRSLNSTDWTSDGNFTTMPMLADIDNDGTGTLEVVGGNTTYKVTINSRTNVAQNKVEVLARAEGVNYDGFVSVADIDMDGRLDVISITNSIGGKPSLVVWDGTTGKIIAGPVSPSVAGGGGSRVFIGDIDFDTDPTGYPELFYSYVNKLVAFKFDPSKPVNNRLSQMWIENTSDGSGATTLSMFDFDQNGSPELVYRDQTDLRIIDAKTGKDKKKISCFSATHSEYPIVVDFDKNGNADILVSGAASAAEGNSDVRLYWFDGADDDWAPARTVWNQHGYNSVHVNDDLTIPRFQINPSTIFPGRSGDNKPVRPYNGFLLQQTALSRDGVPLFLTPNVQIGDANKITYSYDNITDKLIINNLKIVNKGDAALNAPIMISVYNQQIKSESLIYTHQEQRSIGKDETITVAIEIPVFGKYIPTSNLIISVNDDGTGKTKQPVCEECTPSESDTFTNIDLTALAWADPFKNCIDGTVKFNAKDFSTTGTDVRYKWLYPNANQLSTIRNPQITNLQQYHAGRYTVVIEGINNDLSIRYTLPHLSVAPATMYWSGKGNDGNWNNFANWSSDLLGTALSPLAVPAGCTNVHIPYLSAANVRYPSLDVDVTPQDTTQGKTGIYGKPEVNDIIFHYGSELAYQHQLDYKRAKIQYNFGYYTTLVNNTQPDSNKDGASALNIQRNRWYALSAPLKNMATGDFAFGGYPYTWQAVNDIISGNEVTFESKNMTNDVNLGEANNAIVIKSGIYNTGTGYNNHKHLQNLSGVLEIPYFENQSEQAYHPGHYYDRFSGFSTFYYFNAQTLQTIHNPVGRMKRGNESYRFIYEDSNNKIKNVTLNNGDDVPCYVMNLDVSASSHVLIGNPFISSINMERFYEANSGALSKVDGYRLYDGSQWRKYDYITNDGTYNAVNSFQSFIVTFTSVLSNSKLFFPLEGSYGLTGTKTNLTPNRVSLPGALSVKIKNNEGLEGDYAELSPAEEKQLADNVSKLISKENGQTPEVFLVGKNNTGYNLMQVYESQDSEIHLGVRYANTNNDLTLTFGQIDEFVAITGTAPTLIDKVTGIKQNLVISDTYTFRQSVVGTDSNFTDRNRFVIRFRENEGLLSKDSEMVVNYVNNTLTVDSSIGIEKVELYNLSGRKIFASSLLDGLDTRYSQAVNLPVSVYIVKVTGVNNKITSCKFIVR